MGKVFIKDAIESGCWIKCNIYDFEMEMEYKIKIHNFYKLDIKNVDRSEEIGEQELLQEGDIWIIDFELINLSKKQIDYLIFRKLHIVDEDDFEYMEFKDNHLSLYSEFAEKSGLHNFYAVKFIPKFKRRGSISYLVPKGTSEKFSIELEDGVIEIL